MKQEGWLRRLIIFRRGALNGRMKRARVFSFKAIILIAGEQLTLSSGCLAVSLGGRGVCAALYPASAHPASCVAPRRGVPGPWH